MSAAANVSVLDTSLTCSENSGSDRNKYRIYSGTERLIQMIFWILSFEFLLFLFWDILTRGKEIETKIELSSHLNHNQIVTVFQAIQLNTSSRFIRLLFQSKKKSQRKLLCCSFLDRVGNDIFYEKYSIESFDSNTERERGRTLSLSKS